ncbi:hypothetical protein KY335_05435 [Candidatus Woesearchaeota archaeon]|nr:hypothetical protein [Candidatus Woesearchaeota archaeon]
MGITREKQICREKDYSLIYDSVNGYSKGRPSFPGKDGFFPRRQKSIALPSTGLNIQVPDYVRYEELPPILFEHTEDKKERLGMCKNALGYEEYIVYVQYSSMLPLMNSVARNFVKGHEEGHAADYLGGLTDLFSKALSCGYVFDVLEYAYAKSSDAATQKYFSGKDAREQDQKYLSKDEKTSELIADIGGLVALINANENQTAIKIVAKLIEAGQHELVAFFINNVNWGEMEENPQFNLDAFLKSEARTSP